MEFIDQAFTKFMQTAPQLSALVRNFSEVTDQMGEGENPDVRVGVFVLEGGTDVAFVPVISKNDMFYPIDSIYTESTGTFQPLTPKTSEQLAATLGRGKGGLGKAEKIPKGVAQNPDLTSLIVPPRTGKYAYASESRMTEFLALLPAHLKQFTFEKIASESSVYEALDKAFGLRAVFTVLKAQSEPAASGTGAAINSTSTGPAINQSTQISVITTPREIQDLGSQLAATKFMQDGYFINGAPSVTRAAVYASDLKESVFQEVSPQSNPNTSFNIVTKSGVDKRAYLPRYSKFSPGNTYPATIFEDGSYAKGKLIANGPAEKGSVFLGKIFDRTPPILLKDCAPGTEIMLFTVSGEAIGPLNVQNVARTFSGVELGVSGSHSFRKVIGLQDFKFEADMIGDALYVPHNILVLQLLANTEECHLETSVVTATRRNDMLVASLLGAELNLAHDGVEFSINNAPVGGVPAAMKHLIEKEAMDPDVARSFLKKASEEKYVKIFLSKKASDAGSVTPTAIPSYGEAVPPQESPGLNGSFMPAVQNAVGIQDNQTIEATIISQLLQVPDMNEFIGEYLPEIDQAVDRLGRILFVLRLNSDKLGAGADSDSMFSLVAKIRTVYRQLGDSLCALRENIALGVASGDAASAKEEKSK